MKKSVIFACILSLLVPILSGCVQWETRGWQTVEIQDCGTLRLPSDWTCYEKGGLIYIVNHARRPVMIETTSSPSADGRIPGDTEANDFFADITNLRHLTSAVFSNGAIYGTYLTEHQGQQSEKLYLNIGYDRSITLLVWDDTMSESMLKTVAQTFVAAD